MTVPTPEEFSALEVDDACLVILKILVNDEKHAAISYGNPQFPDGIEPLLERRFHRNSVFSSWPKYNDKYDTIKIQLAAAWQHCHQKLYLYQSDQESFSHLTQQGVDFAQREIRFQDVSQLSSLHAAIRAKVEPQFRVGKNSDAIALAFNEVEATVKGKPWPGANPPANGWIALAFTPADPKKGTTDGLLVNPAYNLNEKRSVCNLFQGAFGLYRNLHTHQNPSVSKDETLRVLGLASLLMAEIDKI